MSLRNSCWSSSLLCLVILLGAVLLSTLPVCAQDFTTLYNFTGPTHDGRYPQSVLVSDSAGNLYGTTTQGGSSGNCNTVPFAGCGTVFKMDPAGNETVLYNFTGAPDGAIPLAGLSMDSAGNLYGTTSTGGSGSCTVYSGLNGCGTVFKIDTSGNETVLYSFTGSPDGSAPEAPLIMDAAGNLYGTTPVGGANNDGTVFKLNPTTQVETVLHSFQGATGDGAVPIAGLVMDTQGNVYGTTLRGGSGSGSGCSRGCGTVFKIDTGNNETVLYNFTGGPGPYYGSLVMDAAGNLYGTTYTEGANNRGTVFKLNPVTHVETVLYSFCTQSSCADGDYPEGGVIMDGVGNLFGTTIGGGTSNYIPAGTIFKIDTSGHETVLYSFNDEDDGGGPAESLFMDSTGNLYGTNGGGPSTYCSNGCGTIFEFHTVDLSDYAVLNGNNSLNGNQNVNGNVTATDVLGNGNGLTDLNAANIANGTANININGNAANANTATNANNANNASNLGGVPATNYARLDIANLFLGKQTLVPSAAGYAALNVPNTGVAPSSPLMGDLWLTVADPHLQFVDLNSVTQSIAFLTDVTSQDNQILNTAESYTLTQVGAERTRAEAAESSLSLGIAAETTRGENAESELNSAISDETSRAEEAEASKSDLDGGNTFIGGRQVLAGSTSTYASLNVPNTGAAPSTPLMGDLWFTTANPHLQFRDGNSVIQSLAFLSDITSQDNQILNTAETYTNTQVAVETTRAETAEASLGTAIGNETARAEAAEATKANLSGGNSFSGNQTISGNATVSGNESLNGNLAVAGTVSIGGGTPITEHLSALFNPSFGALHGATCATASFTFTGVNSGDTMALGLPNTRMTGPGNFIYTVWANAANTITIQACNVSSTNQHTAGSGNIRVDVWKH